jgi:hypothetical protein
VSGSPYPGPQLWGNLYNQAVGSQQNTLNRSLQYSQNLSQQLAAQNKAILQGYGSLSHQAQAQATATAQQQAHALQQNQAGYGQLQQNLGNIYGMGAALGHNGNWGVAQPAAQQIAQNQATGQGQILNNAVNTGNLNSSMTGQAERQNQYFANQSYSNLGANLAQLYGGAYQQTGLAGLQAGLQGIGMNTGQQNLATGYGANIGLAGLGYAGQAAGQNLALGQTTLGTLGQLGPLPYPSPGLIGQYGQGGGGLTQPSGVGGGGLSSTGLGVGQGGMGNVGTASYLPYNPNAQTPGSFSMPNTANQTATVVGNSVQPGSVGVYNGSEYTPGYAPPIDSALAADMTYLGGGGGEGG